MLASTVENPATQADRFRTLGVEEAAAKTGIPAEYLTGLLLAAVSRQHIVLYRLPQHPKFTDANGELLDVEFKPMAIKANTSSGPFPGFIPINQYLSKNGIEHKFSRHEARRKKQIEIEEKSEFIDELLENETSGFSKKQLVSEFSTYWCAEIDNEYYVFEKRRSDEKIINAWDVTGEKCDLEELKNKFRLEKFSASYNENLLETQRDAINTKYEENDPLRKKLLEKLEYEYNDGFFSDHPDLEPFYALFYKNKRIVVGDLDPDIVIYQAEQANLERARQRFTHEEFGYLTLTFLRDMIRANLSHWRSQGPLSYTSLVRHGADAHKTVGKRIIEFPYLAVLPSLNDDSAPGFVIIEDRDQLREFYRHIDHDGWQAPELKDEIINPNDGSDARANHYAHHNTAIFDPSQIDDTQVKKEDIDAYINIKEEEIKNLIDIKFNFIGYGKEKSIHEYDKQKDDAQGLIEEFFNNNFYLGIIGEDHVPEGYIFDPEKFAVFQQKEQEYVKKYGCLSPTKAWEIETLAIIMLYKVYIRNEEEKSLLIAYSIAQKLSEDPISSRTLEKMGIHKDVERALDKGNKYLARHYQLAEAAR